MKNLFTVLATVAAIILFCSATPAKKTEQTYQYPFQNPKLSEAERVENLLSLMTAEEKIMSLHGAGVPRLGVPSAGSTEAIHGIAMSVAARVG